MFCRYSGRLFWQLSTGGLVLCFVFLTWLFFTEGELAKAVISLLQVVLFGAVGLACLKAGVYTRKGSVKRRRKK